jgi:hypothetical protein
VSSAVLIRGLPRYAFDMSMKLTEEERKRIRGLYVAMDKEVLLNIDKCVFNTWPWTRWCFGTRYGYLFNTWPVLY